VSLLVKKSFDQVEEDFEDKDRSLKRELGVWDIAVMGVAVAVGAGIFSVGAQAAAEYAGPSVILSFVIAAVICGLAVMNYAEFSSSVPVSGSAYTFSYLSLGELVAWIIGWDLILEMLMAASVISGYWGIYLSSVFEFLHVDLPTTFAVGGVTVAWPPVMIVAFFTTLLVLGTKLTSRVNSVLTVIKVSVTIFIIVAGAAYIDVSNYSPFLPPAEPATDGAASGVLTQSLLSLLSGAEPTRYGVYGLFGAAALVFFAFIGFDVVATTAEEARDPQRTLPRGIFGGLALVSVLYIAVTIVVTGMVSYRDLAATEDPSLATAFKLVGANWAGTAITIGILIGLTTVVMVLLLGLARVIFAMSRDGLLPRALSHTSSRGTPARLQIAGGIIVAVIAAVGDVGVLSEMINIGTLSAFIVVSFSVPVLRKRYPGLPRGFRVPGSPWVPILSGVLCIWLTTNLAVETWLRFIVWLMVGLAIYFGYSYSHSRVRLEAHARNPLAALSPDGAAASPRSSAPERGGSRPAHGTATRAAGVLIALAVVAVVCEAVALISGVRSAEAMPAPLVWGLILAAVPGVAVAHRALRRGDAVEREWDLLPEGDRPAEAVAGAAVRAPLALLSVGYAAIAIAVVIGIVHAVEVL
jgi:APA family basic amino acid/polyamine antiporter